MSNARAAEVEPFLRGCVWPAGELGAYPRCARGPLGLRLPADTRASAAHPVRVRLEFTGACQEVEIACRTQTRELGYRGAGGGTKFVLFRGSARVSEAEAQLGEGRALLAAGPGSARAVVYLSEGMRPSLLAITTPARLARRGRNAAREQGLDVANLGYAGAARGEIASAEALAQSPQT